jgi:hypothetical protein
MRTWKVGDCGRVAMSLGVGSVGERELDLDHIFHQTKISQLNATKVGSVWTKQFHNFPKKGSAVSTLPIASFCTTQRTWWTFCNCAPCESWGMLIFQQNFYQTKNLMYLMMVHNQWQWLPTATLLADWCLPGLQNVLQIKRWPLYTDRTPLVLRWTRNQAIFMIDYWRPIVIQSEI